MSNDLDQSRLIAERIARRVSSEDASHTMGGSGEVSSELAEVRESLIALQRRLAQLETKVRSERTVPTDFEERIGATAGRTSAPPTHSPWLAGVNALVSHPSQERFGVEEAVVSELVDFFQSEKTCTVEPGGKPCDHCAMCSSRGF